MFVKGMDRLLTESISRGNGSMEPIKIRGLKLFKKIVWDIFQRADMLYCDDVHTIIAVSDNQHREGIGNESFRNQKLYQNIR